LILYEITLILCCIVLDSELKNKEKDYPIEYYWNLFSIIILTFTPNNSKHPASDYVKADSKKDKSKHPYKFSRMITKKFQIIGPKSLNKIFSLLDNFSFLT